MRKIIVIPLGGLGTRFKNAGYLYPKPLINVMGKQVIFWLLENLNLQGIEYIYIPYNKELKKYRFEDLLIKSFPHINFKFYCLENNTRGAAETLQVSINYLKESFNETEDLSIMCIDNDNFFTTDIVSQWNGNNVITTFIDNCDKPIFSYVEHHDNIISNIIEKTKISNVACCGVYAFKSINKLLESCNYVIDNNIMEKDEFYTSVVIKYMLSTGEVFYNNTIDKKSYHCLGTPLQVQLFCNNFANINVKNNLTFKKRFCFDLDNTLVSFPQKNGSYDTVKPIVQNINMLKYLKSLGHHIIIHTARSMKSCGGDIGKVIAKVGPVTWETLKKFDIPYDELYFGKPFADFYIDDLAVSSFDNLEKTLGFHNINIKPRDFNNVEYNNNDYVKKSINDEASAKANKKLDGEIYFYTQLSKLPSINKLFPKLLDYDGENNKWFNLEKINGVPLSKIYLNEELTINMLENIMNNLSVIHRAHIDNEYFESMYGDDDINIYGNYCDKLNERFHKYDYSKYKNYNEVYSNIMYNLSNYEKNKLGKIVVIHGDPVLTNILLDEYGQLKFIDVRGKIGNKLTLMGDWLYDWAKLYQSLIGYDEILEERDIDINYKNNLIKFFKTKFIDNFSLSDFNNLCVITKSLLFSLIPLHDNEKCDKYYDLIFSPYLI